MPETAHRYWLLEVRTLNVMDKHGGISTICIYPGDCITITHPKDSPMRKAPAEEVTHDQG